MRTGKNIQIYTTSPHCLYVRLVLQLPSFPEINLSTTEVPLLQLQPARHRRLADMLTCAGGAHSGGLQRVKKVWAFPLTLTCPTSAA